MKITDVLTWARSEQYAKDEEYPTFNNYPHLFIDADKRDSFTISIKFRGERITFAFIECGKDGAECVDIFNHNTHAKITVNQHHGSKGNEFALQKALMFRGGLGRDSVEGSLLTLLLNPLHLIKEEKKEEDKS